MSVKDPFRARSLSAEELFVGSKNDTRALASFLIGSAGLGTYSGDGGRVCARGVWGGLERLTEDRWDGAEPEGEGVRVRGDLRPFLSAGESERGTSSEGLFCS